MRPGLLAVLSPCVVGLTFRVIGAYTGQDLLGAKAVAGLLIFTTVAGMQHAQYNFPCIVTCACTRQDPLRAKAVAEHHRSRHGDYLLPFKVVLAHSCGISKGVSNAPA